MALKPPQEMKNGLQTMKTSAPMGGGGMMTNQVNTPPQTPQPGPGGSQPPVPAAGAPTAQNFNQTNNSNHSVAQWQKWMDEGRLGADGKTWKSSKMCNGQPCPDSQDNPDACPPGWAAHGKDDCKPLAGGAGAGGPGGGGGGPWGGGGAGGVMPGGPGGGGAGGFNPWGSPEQYGLGGYFQSLLNDPQKANAFLAPQKNAIAGGLDQLRQQVKGIGGGAAARMFSQGAGNAAGQMNQLQGSLNQTALGGLTDLSNQNLQNLGQQRSLYGDLTTTGMNNATQRYLGDQQTGLGYYQAGNDYNLGLGGLGFNYANMYNDNAQDAARRQWQGGQNQMDRDAQMKLQKAGQPSTLGKIFGGIGGLAGAFLSDIRTKENVEAYTPGLDAIKALEPISYEYNGKAGSTKGQKAVSFSAQKLEKVIPEAVTRADIDRMKDVRMVDLAKVCATMVNAIKELDEKIEELG